MRLRERQCPACGGELIQTPGPWLVCAFDDCASFVPNAETTSLATKPSVVQASFGSSSMPNPSMRGTDECANSICETSK